MSGRGRPDLNTTQISGHRDSSHLHAATVGFLSSMSSTHMSPTEYGVSIPTLSSPEQAQAFVDARIAEGSDYIKHPRLLSQSTTPPYQFTWSGATTGIHTRLAQVTYDGGSTISSSPANITVTNAGIPVNTTPTNIVAKVSGTNLTLSWPADHIGWRLLTQTNNLARGISRNTNDWGTVANSASTNLVTIPINPTKPAEFYRLVYP